MMAGCQRLYLIGFTMTFGEGLKGPKVFVNLLLLMVQKSGVHQLIG